MGVHSAFIPESCVASGFNGRSIARDLVRLLDVRRLRSTPYPEAGTRRATNFSCAPGAETGGGHLKNAAPDNDDSNR